MRHLMNIIEDAEDAADPRHSPEFRRWFGDSKIVDTSGRPLICYHGTKTAFSSFQPNKVGLIFFAMKRATAAEFSLVNDPDAPHGVRVSHMMQVYLSVQNPFNPKDEHDRKRVLDALDMDAAVKEMEGRRTKWCSPILPFHVENTIRQGMWTTIELPSVVKAIREVGFDGIYLWEWDEPTIAVFHPNQIKSVMNNGSFDPNNPDIFEDQ